MKKLLLTIIASFFVSIGYSQKDKFWSQTTSIEGIEKSKNTQRLGFPEDYKLFTVSLEQLRTKLMTAPDRKNTLESDVIITIPNADGEMERFQMFEASNFDQELQARFPEIRAYVGIGIDDKLAQLRISASPFGIQTIVFRVDKKNEYIEPYSADGTIYTVFSSQRVKGNIPFSCTTDEQGIIEDVIVEDRLQNRSSTGQYKTMRLALSCVAEYSNYFGATSAAQVANVLAGFNATMTRVNGVLEKDLAVHLEIIANTTNLIFYNPSNDPYSGAAAGSGGAWNTELQNTLSNTTQAYLGTTLAECNAAYDIGHLFGASGGGGNAGCIGCVCVNDTASTTDENKGSAFTSPYDGVPAGDNFDIDYVIHEMGHQLGCTHSFAYGGISGAENSSTNVEPGSGSSIMGYAGITGATDVQAHSDDYFTYKNVIQVQSNLASKSCPVTTAITHGTPVVNAGLDYQIPIGTAFKLTGSATDAGGNPLAYCWEQNNDATIISTAASYPSPTKTDGPNFRSFDPVSVPYRYFPSLDKINAGQLVSNTSTNRWESVSNVARTLNFSLTVRDNVALGGQTGYDGAILTVNANAGPFRVTSQSNGANWVQNTNETITWDVANTTALVGSSNVNIKLSTDGGLNFDTILAENTPNDGSEVITVPDVTAGNCRILIEPTGNVYLAVNSRAFTIGYTCNRPTLIPDVSIADGIGSNAAGATTTSVLNVTDDVTISNMKVNLRIDHARIGDLVVRLTHPDGTLRTLWNRSCNSTVYSNIDITFADGTGAIACASPATGTHNASQSSTALAGFNGKPSAGNWTLTVTDNNINNTGSLVTWGLDFGCRLSNNQNSFTDLAVYPNPNKGSFNVQFSNPQSSEVKLSVFDMSGRLIFDNVYANNSIFNENVQLNSAQRGVYLLKIIDGNRKEVKRLIIE